MQPRLVMLQSGSALDEEVAPTAAPTTITATPTAATGMIHQYLRIPLFCGGGSVRATTATGGGGGGGATTGGGLGGGGGGAAAAFSRSSSSRNLAAVARSGSFSGTWATKVLKASIALSRSPSL